MQNFFFATEADEDAVWGMALAIPGIRVFETSTNGPRELRNFKSVGDIRKALTGPPPHVELCLFHSPAGEPPEIEVELANEFGEIKRRTISRWLTIGFMRYAPVNGCLNYCNFSAWNGPTAGERSTEPDFGWDVIDWKQHASVFRKLKRQIEKAAPARFGSIPILPDAFAKLSSGEIKLWGAGEEISLSSPHIAIKPAKLR